MGIKSQNLINYIGQLNQGQRLIKIGNSYLPIGISNSINFYKCASVDTNLSTWTGYKAIQNPITYAYSFEETITSGLTYNIITPTTGDVYSNNALIKVLLYTEINSNTEFDQHTIFLLDVDTLTDKTGNFIVSKDNISVSFTTSGGLFGQNNLIFPDKGCLLLEAQNGLTIGGNQDYTIQLWYTCLNDNNLESFFPFFGPNQSLTDDESFQFHGGYSGNSVYMWQTNTDTIQWYYDSFEYGSTHHIALSRRASDNNWKCWVDGQVCSDWNYYDGCVNDPMSLLYIGNGFSGSRYNKAAIQDYRISNCIRYTTDSFQVPSSALN